MDDPLVKPLTVRLFGRFEVRAGGQPVSGLRARDGERVLAYIALRAGEDVTYRSLAEQFWPFEARANQEALSGDFPSVRQAMCVVRRALGDHAHALVSGGKGMVRLDLAAASVDLISFRDAIRAEDPARWAAAAEVCLSGGPLLEGWRDPWAATERERSERSLDRVVAKLIEAALASGDVGEAAAWQERIRAFADRANRNGTHSERDGILFESLRLTLPSEVPPHEKPPTDASSSSHGFDPECGPVPLDSIYYIERDLDARFLTAIRDRHSIVLLKGARQTGKSSLLARGLREARALGARVALTDLQSAHESDIRTPNELQLALGSSLSIGLGLDVFPVDEWRSGLSPNSNLELFVRRRVLTEADPPLVWAIDEADRLLRSPAGNEVLGLLRSWHNQRSLHPDGPWSRLTIVLAYATEAHLFITDLNQSPFNVGTVIAMRDFSMDETMRLNRAFGDPLKTEADVEVLHQLLGGHPHLTRRALDSVMRSGESMDSLAETAASADGPFGEHLKRMLLTLHQESRLEAILIALVKQGIRPDVESFFRLRSAGILTGPSAATARFRCPVYERFIGSQLA